MTFKKTDNEREKKKKGRGEKREKILSATVSQGLREKKKKKISPINLRNVINHISNKFYMYIFYPAFETDCG